MKNKIEFYDGDNLIAVVDSAIVPPVGSKINIRKKTWMVDGITYALDHASMISERCMRANVDLVAC
jgi:hypothetical protein